ncbi:hypothetical protein Cgig2_005010 [Carnegiea gigantea]|uniref:Uncharacterized protein n=1 Tax=Carnegiea gigantea TaxID=171969 RepID=A0A9Q1KZS3_9CARY|nr:hypothetical protein Cgig2_005010 [Carnegiea gigantea]
MVITNTGITILPQVTNERRTVEPQQLVPIGGATLIPRWRVSSTRRLGLDRFAVLFKTGQNFRAVMDLQNTVYVRPVLKIIQTTFFPESPSKSSETACLVDSWSSRRFGFWKISPQVEQGIISLLRGKMGFDSANSDLEAGRFFRGGSRLSIGVWTEWPEDLGDKNDVVEYWMVEILAARLGMVEKTRLRNDQEEERERGRWIWIGFLGMRGEDEAAQIEEKEEEREKEFVESVGAEDVS